MEVAFKTGALADIEFWKRSGNKLIQKKIQELLNSIAQTPENGIGKPEKLKGNLTGYWSQRINIEHRIVYAINNHKNIVTIFSLKGHY